MRRRPGRHPRRRARPHRPPPARAVVPPGPAAQGAVPLRPQPRAGGAGAVGRLAAGLRATPPGGWCPSRSWPIGVGRRLRRAPPALQSPAAGPLEAGRAGAAPSLDRAHEGSAPRRSARRRAARRRAPPWSGIRARGRLALPAGTVASRASRPRPLQGPGQSPYGGRRPPRADLRWPRACRVRPRASPSSSRRSRATSATRATARAPITARRAAAASRATARSDRRSAMSASTCLLEDCLMTTANRHATARIRRPRLEAGPQTKRADREGPPFCSNAVRTLLDADDERRAAVETARLLARVVELRTLLAVAPRLRAGWPARRGTSR